MTNQPVCSIPLTYINREGQLLKSLVMWAKNKHVPFTTSLILQASLSILSTTWKWLSDGQMATRRPLMNLQTHAPTSLSRNQSQLKQFRVIFLALRLPIALLLRLFSLLAH